MLFDLVILHLLLVHSPGGQEIRIVAEEISTLREPQQAEGHFVKGTHCIVVMANSRLVSTEETCQEIAARIDKFDGEGEKQK